MPLLDALKPAHVAPDWRGGARLAVVVGTPLVGGVLLGFPSIALMLALGALNVGLGLPDGNWQLKLRSGVVISVLLGLVTFIGLVAQGPATGIVAIAVITFCCAITQGLGSRYAAGAFVVGVMIVLGLSLPAVPGEEWLSGLEVVIGGLWGTLVMTFLWPLGAQRAIRTALGAVYSELADFYAAAPHSSHERSAAIDRLNAALNNSYDVIVEYRSRKWSRSDFSSQATAAHRRAAALQLYLGSFDKTYGDVTPIPEELQDGVNELAQACRDISAQIHETGRYDSWALAQAVKTLQAQEYSGETQACEQLVAEMSESLTKVHPHTADPFESFYSNKWTARLSPDLAWSRFRSLLHWDSITLRHALRVSVLMAIAQFLAGHDPIANGYWIPLTVWIVLQPDYGSTMAKGVQRLVGTVIGALLAFLIVDLFYGNDVMLACLAVFTSFGIATFVRINYTYAVVFITPTVILMLSLVGGGENLWWVRIANTLVGALLAFVGGYLLWPSWQVVHIPRRVCEATAAAKAYAAAVLRGEPDREQSRRLHRKAEWTRSNADAALQRMMSEPEHKRIDPTLLMEYCRKVRETVDDSALYRLGDVTGAEHQADQQLIDRDLSELTKLHDEVLTATGTEQCPEPPKG